MEGIDQLTERANIDSQRVLPAGQYNMYAIDGYIPHSVVAPQTDEEVCAVLRTAYESDWKVLPYGGGTAMSIGYPPSRMDIVLDMRYINSIVDFAPADMIVIAEAGVKLANLQAELRQGGLFLPIDPPHATHATIGGIIATNAAGPLRCAYGTVRDWLIGIHVVQPDGTMTNFGGRVVKNVAGYDMMKLYAGSYGTLGVITRAVFRLLPLPEAEVASLIALSTDEAVEKILTAIVHSYLQPSSVVLMDASVASQINWEKLTQLSHGYTLMVTFHDFAEAIEYQLNMLIELLPASDAEVIDTAWGTDARNLRERVGWLQSGEGALLHIRITVLPSDIIPMSHCISTLAVKHEIECAMIAHALDGVVYCSVSNASDATLARFATQLLDTVSQWRGNMIIERAPTHLKRSLPVWGRSLNTFTLMRRIKELLDPKCIMCPGRFIGGL